MLVYGFPMCQRGNAPNIGSKRNASNLDGDEQSFWPTEGLISRLPTSWMADQFRWLCGLGELSAGDDHQRHSWSPCVRINEWVNESLGEWLGSSVSERVRVWVNVIALYLASVLVTPGTHDRRVPTLFCSMKYVHHNYLATGCRHHWAELL